MIDEKGSEPNRYGYFVTDVKNYEYKDRAYIEFTNLLLLSEKKMFVDVIDDSTGSKTNYEKLKRTMRIGDRVYICDMYFLGDSFDQMLKEIMFFLKHGVDLVYYAKSYKLELTENILGIKLFKDIFERENKVRQLKGFENMPTDVDGRKYSAKTHRYRGRPRVEYPENWEKVLNEVEKGNITATEAMRKMGLKSTSYYKLRKKYLSEG